MVGHSIKIKGLSQLHLKPAGMANSLALRIAIGIMRCRSGAKSGGIKGERCVHVQIAKIGIALGVWRWALRYWRA